MSNQFRTFKHNHYLIWDGINNRTIGDKNRSLDYLYGGMLTNKSIYLIDVKDV